MVLSSEYSYYGRKETCSETQWNSDARIKVWRSRHTGGKSDFFFLGWDGERGRTKGSYVWVNLERELEHRREESAHIWDSRGGRWEGGALYDRMKGLDLPWGQQGVFSF